MATQSISLLYLFMFKFYSLTPPLSLISLITVYLALRSRQVRQVPTHVVYQSVVYATLSRLGTYLFSFYFYISPAYHDSESLSILALCVESALVQIPVPFAIQTLKRQHHPVVFLLQNFRFFFFPERLKFFRQFPPLPFRGSSCKHHGIGILPLPSISDMIRHLLI